MLRRAEGRPGCGRLAAAARRSRLLLRQLVRVGGGQGEAVDRLELVDLGEDGRPEGCLALEGVQDDALNEVTEGQVEVLGQALEDFQRVALDAKAGLHSLNCYHGNKITFSVDAQPSPKTVLMSRSR